MLSARSSTASGVPYIARDGEGRAAAGGEFVEEPSDCRTVDIGRHDRHAESAGMPGQAGADAGTGTGDDGDAAAE